MKIAIPPIATSERLTEAALVLLDAARAAVAEQAPADRQVANIISAVTAVAVQAVLTADHWPARSPKDPDPKVRLDPKVMLELVEGGAVGLGIVIAAVPYPDVRLILKLMAAKSLGDGESYGAQSRGRGDVK